MEARLLWGLHGGAEMDPLLTRVFSWFQAGAVSCWDAEIKCAGGLTMPEVWALQCLQYASRDDFMDAGIQRLDAMAEDLTQGPRDV